MNSRSGNLIITRIGQDHSLFLKKARACVLIFCYERTFKFPLHSALVNRALASLINIKNTFISL